jgi:hypothetical protein
MRDPKYRRWLTSCRCLLAVTGYRGSLCDGGPSDPAHTENNGMRSKGPDSSCVPLCRKHHHEYDAGRAAFEEKYRLDMQGLAHMYYMDYLEENSLVPK